MINANKNVGLKLSHRLVTFPGYSNSVSEGSTGWRVAFTFHGEGLQAGMVKGKFGGSRQRTNPQFHPFHCP